MALSMGSTDDDIQAVKTVCGICNGTCGLELTLQNGAVIGVSGRKDALSQGYICPKGKALVELLNAPDRIRKPLLREKDDRWQEITWDEAIDVVAQELQDIKKTFGAQAVAVHVGQTGVRKEFANYIERFCNAFGTPNCSSSGSHCHSSRAMGHAYTVGALTVPDFENSACIVLWGSNPSASCPPLMTPINRALSRGAKLLVVDPRAHPLARKADVHLQLRPGTDGAVALGLLNVIIQERLYDQDFVDNWTVGFPQLAALVRDYPPPKVEQITWVPAAKLIEAAYLIAQASPACLTTGVAVELHTNGFQTVRALAILQAITGNLDIPGGSLLVVPAKLAPFTMANPRGSAVPAIGQKEYPLFFNYAKRAQANLFARAIIQEKPYPIKGMMVAGSNPVLTWPNATRVREALTRLEFLAVIDHFMTETAKLADLVLPAASFLARPELWDGAPIYGVQKIGLAPTVLSEEGQMTDWRFWNRLANKMGFGESFPWASEEEAIRFRLKPLGITIESLERCPEGYEYEKKQAKKYVKTGFKTPSGKVELYCRQLEERGYDPLPRYVEPYESPLSMPEMADRYPLILTTGARRMEYFHSRYRNLPSLRRLQPEPVVEMHPALAQALRIKEGEAVVVESIRGQRIALKASLTETIDPRIISVLHGWNEANANCLTDDEVLDPFTGFPSYRSLLARVEKAISIFGQPPQETEGLSSVRSWQRIGICPRPKPGALQDQDIGAKRQSRL